MSLEHLLEFDGNNGEPHNLDFRSREDHIETYKKFQ